MRPFPPNAPGADDAAKRLPPQSGPSANPQVPAAEPYPIAAPTCCGATQFFSIPGIFVDSSLAPVTRHSWLAKQPSADLESEFRDAADESTSLLHRPPSRFRDAAQ